MVETAQRNLINLLNNSAEPLANHDDYESLLKKIGDANFVLLGEATHGTYEFYQARAEITKKLIALKGFNVIAVEADWPDAYQVNRYLQGSFAKADWQSALSQFNRFPQWMWCNQAMPPLLTWLREYNDKVSPTQKVGFFGIDLYSLFKSMQAVIDYLQLVDPEAAKRAKERYSCFDHAKTDPQNYGLLASQGDTKKCVQEAIEQLHDLQTHVLNYLKNDSLYLLDEYFYAKQNARVVKHAEEYYRSLFESHQSSWNLRDTYMAETLQLLQEHIKQRNKQTPKIIVWAHNSHVGNALATEMGESGEINLGQLLKEKYKKLVYSVGFSTYQGTVTAASEWGGEPEIKTIIPGIKGSYEYLFHQLDFPNFLLDLHQDELEYYLNLPRLQRAIGVIYRPETERLSHYFFTKLPWQFDNLIHFDHTNILKPLDLTQ